MQNNVSPVILLLALPFGQRHGLFRHSLSREYQAAAGMNSQKISHKQSPPRQTHEFHSLSSLIL